LLIAKPGTKRLSEMITDQNLISVRVDEDREEVAHLIARYNFLALPVIDSDNRLLGVVTVDDVIDIIHEEASEDMQAMVGAGADETTDSPWSYSVKKRLPWLVTNVATSAVSALVVHMFEGSVSQMAILAVLMPVVANQAGNTGQQALAVMIRQLATDRFDRRKSWLAVVRELRIGLVNGALISSLVLLSVLMLTSNIALAGVMGMALYFDMLMGSLAGASIPLILKELGRDPAQASSIFLTTITDSLGFFSLLGLAGLLLLS
jgi:magnesium transporter